MKGIGVFVVVLLVALGVTSYVVTRAPERQLDDEGEAWVSAYEGWNTTNLRELEDALLHMDFGARARNARLIEPLRRCSASFTRIGEPPEVLEDVHRIVLEGCARAEHAVRLNDRFGAASLATIKLHLGEAEDRLLVAQRTLRTALGEEASTS